MSFAFPTKRLAELAAAIDYGVTASALSRDTGTKFLRITDIQDGSVDWEQVPFCEAQDRKLRSARLDDGDIVFARTGATTGKSFLIKEPPQGAVFASYLIRVKPAQSIYPSYLAHYFQSAGYWSQILKKTQGAAQGGVNATSLSELEIPIPPLDQQRRIAAILDKADALRRQRRRAIEIGECLSSSAFREMFGRSLGLPEVSLAELIDPDDKINYGVVQPGDNDPDGVFLVRVSDLQNGKVSHAQLRKVACEVSNKHRRSLLLGYEILISCVGSTGGIAVATEAEKGFNIARAVARVPIKDRVLRDYVAEYLRSSSVQEYFRKELRTVSQPTLNIKQISETRIPLAPIARMQAFVQQAETIRGLQEDAAAAATRQDALFKSLQQRAFSGRF